MEFSKEELKWIENHKDMINNSQFYDLFIAADTFPHGSILERAQFPSKLNFVLYKAGLNIFNDGIPTSYFWACKDLTSIDLNLSCCSRINNLLLSLNSSSVSFKYFFKANCLEI